MEVNGQLYALVSLPSGERSADAQLEVGWTVELERMLWGRENSLSCWEYNLRFSGCEVYILVTIVTELPHFLRY